MTTLPHMKGDSGDRSSPSLRGCSPTVTAGEVCGCSLHPAPQPRMSIVRLGALNRLGGDLRQSLLGGQRRSVGSA